MAAVRRVAAGSAKRPAVRSSVLRRGHNPHSVRHLRRSAGSNPSQRIDRASASLGHPQGRRGDRRRQGWPGPSRSAAEMYGRNGPHPGHSCYLGVNFRFVQLVPLPLRRESVNEATSETERNDSAVPPCRRARRSRHSRRPCAGSTAAETGSGLPVGANVSTATTDADTQWEPATTVPKDNVAQSLIEWAESGMRSHGDPGQPDPTIDSHGGINISIPSSASVAFQRGPQGTAPCNQYLAAASAALRAGATDLAPPDQAALVQFSDCMRANGVPNYPDPGTGGTTNFNGTGIDLNSPFFQRANDRAERRSTPRPGGSAAWAHREHLGGEWSDVWDLGAPSA